MQKREVQKDPTTTTLKAKKISEKKTGKTGTNTDKHNRGESHSQVDLTITTPTSSATFAPLIALAQAAFIKQFHQKCT